LGSVVQAEYDDTREAPSRDLIEALWEAGSAVRAYDPVAMTEARRLYGERQDLALCQRAEEALEGADALVIVTEWREFRSPDFDVIKQALKKPVIFDGRNIFDPKIVERFGIKYYGIGRGATVTQA
jgi:UDPglucose 6-dehydrogenase